jgi:hypothetical protein
MLIWNRYEGRFAWQVAPQRSPIVAYPNAQVRVWEWVDAVPLESRKVAVSEPFYDSR